MSPRLVVLKNAACNVVRGGASALVALVLPYFLTRALPAEKYAIWVLALQLSAYVNYLDAGIQTAIARFVAQCIEKNEHERRDRIVNSAGLLLTGAMVLGCGLLLVANAAIPYVYPRMAHELISELRVCILLVGGSLAIGLPASVFTGILVGYQRNEIPALAIGGSKLAGAAVIVLATRHTQNLATLAMISAGFNVISYAVQYVWAARLLNGIRYGARLITRRVMRELSSYCASLSTCSIGMLLVSGLDLTLVGVFDFKRVGAYSIGSTLVLFVAGMNSSVFGSLLAPMARMHARRESGQLGKLVLSATSLAVLLNLAAALPLFVFSDVILSHWVAAEYVVQAVPLMRMLLVANVLRTAFNPYSTAVISAGQQRLIMISPVAEGTVNVAASIVAGHFLGATGVAIGTLVGTGAGMIWTIFYNIPRTDEVSLTRWDFTKEGMIRPAACILPVCAALIASSGFPSQPQRFLILLGAGCSGLFIIWSARSSLRATRLRDQAIPNLSPFANRPSVRERAHRPA